MRHFYWRRGLIAYSLDPQVFGPFRPGPTASGSKGRGAWFVGIKKGLNMKKLYGISFL